MVAALKNIKLEVKVKRINYFACPLRLTRFGVDIKKHLRKLNTVECQNRPLRDLWHQRLLRKYIHNLVIHCSTIIVVHTQSGYTYKSWHIFSACTIWKLGYRTLASFCCPFMNWLFFFFPSESQKLDEKWGKFSIFV